MQSKFILRTPDNKVIRFRYYIEEAPETCKAFEANLPFKVTFFHARLSGQEIWTDKPPVIDVIQENASVFTYPGEVVYGPLRAQRTKTANCMGIYYGQGQGLDCANIFAIVHEKDLPLLEELGEKIWKQGEQVVSFESTGKKEQTGNGLPGEDLN